MTPKYVSLNCKKKNFGVQAVNEVPLGRDYQSAIENVIVGLKKN